ncbi:MAG TPA: hypothetical protein VF158_06095 [Longimicrobiales bacterium]
MRRLTMLGTAALLFAATALWLACDEDATPTATAAGAEARPEAFHMPAPDAGARPNLTARATSPAGHVFRLEYQPDWVSKITVTRRAPDGSPSTAVLFRNSSYKLRDPGPVVRTRIASPENGLDFEVILNDPGRVVKRITVETVAADGASAGEPVVFTIEDDNPPPDEPGIPDDPGIIDSTSTN